MRGPDRVGRLIVLGGLATTATAILLAVTLVEFDADPTTTAGQIGGLHRQLLLVAVPVAVLVEGVLAYTVWRFRNNEDRTPTPDNRRLELGWTVATGLVLVFVGIASYQVMASPAVTAPAGESVEADAVEVHVTGHQWYWSVTYPTENVSVGRADRIVLPVNRTIRVRITTADVIHSFFAPELALKQDAIPGRANVIRTRITETGAYRVYCAEYCGQGHARMQATIVVVSDAEYRSWLASQRNRTNAADDQSVGDSAALQRGGEAAARPPSDSPWGPAGTARPIIYPSGYSVTVAPT